MSSLMVDLILLSIAISVGSIIIASISDSLDILNNATNEYIKISRVVPVGFTLSNDTTILVIYNTLSTNSSLTLLCLSSNYVINVTIPGSSYKVIKINCSDIFLLSSDGSLTKIPIIR